MSDTYVGIPIRTTRFLSLVDFLRTQGSQRDPIEVIDAAIDYWIDNASWKQGDLLPDSYAARSVDSEAGYMWKELWIPENSDIRMKYKGRLYSGKVERSGVLYNGRHFTPSEFVFEVTKTSRNAWKDLEIFFPGSSGWRLADELRRANQ